LAPPVVSASFAADTSGWLGLSTELWAGIVGALVGAIVGGLISLGLQWLGVRASRLEREKESAQARLVLGYRILLKLIKMRSMLGQIADHLEAGHPEKRKEAGLVEWWGSLQPFIGLTPIEQFSSEELALLVHIKRIDLAQRMMEADESYNVTYLAMTQYARDREVLRTLLPPALEFHGEKASMEWDSIETASARPKMLELNSLASHLYETVPAHSRASNCLTDALLNAFLVSRILPLSVRIEPRQAGAPPQRG